MTHNPIHHNHHPQFNIYLSSIYTSILIMHFLFQKYDHVASTVLQLELIKLKVNTITCRLVFFYMINFNEKCSTL